MKPNKNTHIADLLTERGFHKLNELDWQIMKIGKYLRNTVPFVIVFARLAYCVYYYPRSISYLMKYPISEVSYLINNTAIFFFIAVVVFISIYVISIVVRIPIHRKATRILKQVYSELGLNAPENEFIVE